MLRYFIIFVFLAASFALFVSFIDPLYKDVKMIQANIVQLNDAINNSRQIQEIRDVLIKRFDSISSKDLDKIKKVLPDHVDNIRLILEVDRIASEHGLVMRGVRVLAGEIDPRKTLGPDEGLYGTTGLDVTVAGSYGSFVDFLEDLERGLRIVDIRTISFSAAPLDFNQYTVGLKTYWLK